MQEMGWKKVAFVVSSEMEGSWPAWQAAMEERGIIPSPFIFPPGGDKTLFLAQIDLEFRVIMLMCYDQDKRDFVVTMIDLGLNIDKYAIITDLASPSMHLGSDGRDAEVQQAMEGMLSITFSPPTGEVFDHFLSKLSSQNAKLEWRQQLNNSVAYPSKVRLGADNLIEMEASVPSSLAPYAAYLYDAVMLYARGLHNLTQGDGDTYQAQGGYALQYATQRQQFEGMSGAVQLDENGDRQLNIEFLNVMGNKSWPVVARYDAQSQELSLEGSIIWMDGGSVPPSDSAPQPKTILHLGLLNPLSGGGWDLPEVAGAAKLAVDDINNNTDILPDMHLQLIVKDSSCEVETGTQAALELLSQGVQALIGPACR